MPECSLEALFPSPWGIVEHRRAEIEAAGYGGFERILDDEIRTRFLPIDRVAELMDVHASTARRWMRDHDARYFVHDSRALYHADDVAEIIGDRRRMKAAAKERAVRRAQLSPPTTRVAIERKVYAGE